MMSLLSGLNEVTRLTVIGFSEVTWRTNRTSITIRLEWYRCEYHDCETVTLAELRVWVKMPGWEDKSVTNNHSMKQKLATTQVGWNWIKHCTDYLCGCSGCRCARLVPQSQCPLLEDRGYRLGGTGHPRHYKLHPCAWYHCTPSIQEAHWQVEGGSGGQWGGCQWKRCMGQSHGTWSGGDVIKLKLNWELWFVKGSHSSLNVCQTALKKWRITSITTSSTAWKHLQAKHTAAL